MALGGLLAPLQEISLPGPTISTTSKAIIRSAPAYGFSACRATGFHLPCLERSLHIRRFEPSSQMLQPASRQARFSRHLPSALRKQPGTSSLGSSLGQISPYAWV